MANSFYWDYFNNRVQDNLQPGEFLNAAYALLSSGPPQLSEFAVSNISASSANTWEAIEGGLESAVSALSSVGKFNPIGVTQALGINQGKQLMQIWEIGSERSFFVSGRASGSLSLGRVLYNGDNLLKMLYAWDDSLSETAYNGFEIFRAPGYNNFYMNLASDLFGKPFGLLLLIKDSQQKLYAAVYFEQCYVPNYGFGFDAAGNIIQESTSLLFERMIPIPTSMVVETSSS